MKAIENHHRLLLIGISMIMGLFLSVKIASAYNFHRVRVEYREYTDSSRSHTRVPIIFTDDAGNWVDPNLTNLWVEYEGNPIETDLFFQDWFYELYGDYEGSAWKFDSTLTHFYYIIAKIAPFGTFESSDAPPGDYTLFVETEDETYRADMVFNGRQVLPSIDATTFDFGYNAYGDLTISWELPDQSSFPGGSTLSLAAENADDYHYGGYFNMPTTVDSITIPGESLLLLKSPSAFNVAMRTHSQDFSNRFYSDIVTIQGNDIPVETDGPYTLHLARVEYRNYYDASSNQTRVPLMFTDDNGNWVNPSISDIRIEREGAQIETHSLWRDWYYELLGNYDEDNSVWTFASSLDFQYYTRVNIAPSGDLENSDAPPGTYHLTVDTADKTYHTDLTFEGKKVLPRIDASTIECGYNLDGDLMISWSLPGQSVFPSGSFLTLIVENADDWHYSGYFHMPSTVDHITIPRESIALLNSPKAFTVYMRTQTQDHTSRYYSDLVTVQVADIPDDTRGDGWVFVRGAVTYNDTPLCAMVLANGQYMFTCKDGDDFGRYALEVPLDGNGEVSIQVFASGLAPFRDTIEPTKMDIDIAMQAVDTDSESPVVTAVFQTDDSLPDGWVNFKGTVTLNGAPLCAMVLANGQYMFSCNPIGEFGLTVPVDQNNEILLYGFSSGLTPYKQRLSAPDPKPVDPDQDKDGYTVSQGDCDDDDDSIHPGASEIANDGIDQDCNGSDLIQEVDRDGDGFTASQGDCNDNDSSIHPGAIDIANDGIDQDCNGSDLIVESDEDGDGYTVAQGDCNDNDSSIHPGASEINDDGIDQNCNGNGDDPSSAP